MEQVSTKRFIENTTWKYNECSDWSLGSILMGLGEFPFFSGEQFPKKATLVATLQCQEYLEYLEYPNKKLHLVYHIEK
jgi:hypothetical protein